MKLKLGIVGLVTIFFLQLSCGSKKSSNVGGGSGSSSGSSFSVSTYPADFVIASPVASSSKTSLKLASNQPADFETLKAEISTLLSASDISKCTFTLMDAPTTSPACYGPSLDYKNHPDFTTPSAGQTSSDGTFPGGDLGIWTKYSSSDTDTTQESCVSAKMNSLIGQAATYVGNAEKAMAFLQCVAKNSSSVSLPTAVGDSLDLLSQVDSAKPEGFSFSKASITYSADYKKSDGTSTPIYLSTVVFSNSTGKLEYTINLKHTTTDTTQKYYRGKLWVYAVPSSGNSSLQKTTAYSVMYEKADSTTITYSVKNSNFVKTATESDMFDSDKTVNTPASNDGYSWGLFKVDSSDGTGKVAYAWVAGTVEENARSFLASVTADSDAKKTGVGYFGFGDSMKNILSEYKSSGTFSKFLDRMICNWAGPGNNHSGSAYVQKQIIEQDSSTGVFKPTSSFITYVPRNSCGLGSGENNSSFTFRSANSTDAYGNFGTTNLVTISTEKAGTYSDVFNIPSPPSEF